MDEFLDDHTIHDKFQPGFRRGRSTEMAQVKLTNGIYYDFLTAAFDKADHKILLDRLEKWIGL